MIDQVYASCSRTFHIAVLSPLRRTVVYHRPFLCIAVENFYVAPMTHLTMSVGGTSEKLIVESLERGDSFSTILELSSYAPLGVIQWILPSRAKCRVQFEIPGPPKASPEYPIQLSLVDVPQLVTTFTPFPVSMNLKNQSEKVLDGQLVVDLADQSLVLYGKNCIEFKRLQPGTILTIPLQFVAMIEGDFTFPAFVLKIEGDDGVSFSIKPTEGLLVVGGTP
jgi:hypothetical protein